MRKCRCGKTMMNLGHGPLDAKMMLVLEWPGKDELKRNVALAGGYGGVIANVLRACNIQKDAIRIEYAHACGPWRKTPSLKESKHCTEPEGGTPVDVAKAMPRLQCVLTMGQASLRAMTGCRNLVSTPKSPGWAGSPLSPADVRRMQVQGSLPPGVWLVPTWGPDFIMRGNAKFFQVWRQHVQMAGEITQNGGLEILPTNYMGDRDLRSLFEGLNDSAVIALDLETDRSWKKIELVGLSWAPGEAVVCRWNEDVKSALWYAMEECDFQWVMHNASFDEARLIEHGIPIPEVTWDTMVASNVIASHLPVGLGFVAPLYLKVPQWKHEAGQDMVKYNAMDADYTRRLYDVQQVLMSNKLKKHVREVVMPARRVFMDMQLEGIKVDEALLQVMVEDNKAEVKKLREEWDGHTGAINPASSKAKIDYFVGRLGLEPSKKHRTSKGGVSFGKEALEELAEKHPEVRELQILRKMASLEALRKGNLELELGPGGRLHPKYNMVSTTGRVASGADRADNTKVSSEARFNAMNIPVQYRRIYVPNSRDHILCEVDYAGIEFHILAALARDHAALEVLAAGQKIHGVVAAKAFGCTYEEVMDELKSSGADPDCMYQRGKKVRHSMSYGAGNTKLANITGLPVDVIAKVKEAEERAFPKIAQYKRDTVELGQAEGYLENPFGRRRYFPDRKKVTEMLAFIPQSTALDMALDGMVRLDAMCTYHGWTLNAFTHDSFLLNVYKQDRDKVSDVLETVLCREYPMIMPGFKPKIDVAFGENWSVCK